jgi:hypothetical protein
MELSFAFPHEEDGAIGVARDAIHRMPELDAAERRRVMHSQNDHFCFVLVSRGQNFLERDARADERAQSVIVIDTMRFGEGEKTFFGGGGRSEADAPGVGRGSKHVEEHDARAIAGQSESLPQRFFGRSREIDRNENRFRMAAATVVLRRLFAFHHRSV